MPILRRFKKPVVSPQPISAGPRLLSIKDAAAYLGASVWAIRQMLRNRQLPYVPVGEDSRLTRLIWIVGSSGKRSEREWQRELSGIMVALTGFEPVFPP